MTEPGSASVPADVQECVDSLARAAGRELLGIVFFGSRLVNTTPNRFSAADLFVVVDDLGRFYRRLHDAGLVRRSVALLTAANRVLPPNVMRLGATPSAAGCKCFFISRTQLERELGPHSHDHFCKGRLTQIVAIVHARDQATHAWLTAQLRRSREDSLRWVGAYLPRRFGPRDYCLAMMRQSYRSEIRPESADRVLEVLEAQGDDLLELYRALLEEAGPRRGIVATGELFEQTTLPRTPDAYFARSRIRATLRWLKYLVTFENWLDYIVQKLHRRSAVEVRLSRWERRLPLLLLWPKFFRVLWQLQRHQVSAPPREENDA
jgi:hypothetical protein